MNSPSKTEPKDFGQLLTELQEKYKLVKQGGGPKRIAKEHEKGKLTARERIDYLIDEQSDFLEIGAFAADGMYEEEGGCPSAGVVTGIGYVRGRMCVIVANDATVKAGAWFPMTAKKNLRAQEVAMENRLPIIYLVDSAGVFLPMQNEIFPDKEHFGRQFRNNAKMSSLGIVQVAAIMGSCVAGGAYLPIMSDEAMIVDKTGSIFLAGSYLVKAAIGESVDNETLGGATTHCEISGVTDNKYDSDQDCLDAIKNIFDKLGASENAGFDRSEPKDPGFSGEELLKKFPLDRVKPYDMLEVISGLVDGGEFDEYKKDFGKTLICGTARIDGWAVGIVANQRKIVKTAKGEMQMGGVIYSDSADKAARFIMNCNQRKIPLVFLQDVSGFMVGSKAEHGGIIKDGAKMVNAMANSVVPKFTIVLGNSYGAGNYAMCGKAYDPRLIYSWPTAQMAVMSGASAAKTLLQIKVSSLKKAGKEEITPEEEKELLDEITNKYNEELSPYYAAARLWVDGVIDPRETRKVISMGIKAANHNPISERFNVGVIQT
ncbi:MAG TPA: methylcrotonoyl-CoA carboxylase [Algoriphagus sp.]|jgi:acetyl-CoA carboxylase carboxyltransferase component|uniref:acyl-CoA carboxylase subunit beta n=4 Tax=Algoriphagus TaxID=246875 RepID=UPI000C509ED6|nr:MULTISPECIES: acyl-CoA carboxylase subunit beta [unclassified Algoriphagus]MAL12529.1 methylcrotonoyl-CoA carboxylase [Algoriphagus sp.]MAN87488.1 methylcrotonoyl-CoA carboxylase [Algoriphagus sp.]QYH38031.1 acyl-CoA carboxylase subunit beta [Algoriphagus sp. NBT04N3]HAS58426.1 methylcrotonoyl-CoA carboxylase [Algoriphagus sp.]HAZ24380.1 methylcrotonoyl-CoA carboxylase [Algoriphagus sp.]|tara:strand:+ start:609 stop:2240 length:1632 start_codon:yes stop_codon:yes gene_type:complete